MKIWDISLSVGEETAVFPGDTEFSREWVMRMEGGGSCNVSTIRMSVHCGTHTDAPLHFDVAGEGMAEVGLAPYLGPCRVVTVAGVGDPPLVPAEALGRGVLDGVQRVLLHTQTAVEPERFDPSFTALGPDAAAVLVDRGIALVGIDTPSMDHATSKDLAGHNVLYAGGVVILENLDLTGVRDGDYELVALPLKIVGADASPVRAVLVSR